jgi:superfamily II DNA/RNA helicase
MLQVANKTIVADPRSKKQTWDSLGVPEPIQKGLHQLAFQTPSLIQSFSLPHIVEKQNENFVF